MKIRSLLCLAVLGVSIPAYAQQAATPVFVTDIKLQDFVDEIAALGTLQANENVDLTSSVTERITKINFESGQRVKKGDVLVEMDYAEEQALLTEEQSVLAEAQRQVARLTPLIKRGATSQSTLDAAQLEAQTSRSRIAAIESQIHERRIIAPFDGKLGLRDISVGVMAQPGTLITTIDDDTIMKLDFSVPEVFLTSIKEGGKISAGAKAYPNEAFEGTVESVDSRIDAVTRAISVRALLKNDDLKLKPGMLMRVLLYKDPRKSIVIPEEAIVPKGDKNYVYTVSQAEGGHVASLVPIELGSRQKGIAEVLSGLKDGDQVVTHGTMKIQDGSHVIVKAKDNGNPPLADMLKQDMNKGE